MRHASRMEAVLPPIIPIVADLIRRTPGTISLGQGVVGYSPPPAALAALAAISPDPREHQYGPDEGQPDLLEAIARKLATENGIETGTASRIVVTAGSNMAFGHAVLAVADPGDEIILPAPFYFNHHMAVAIAGCRPVSVPTTDGGQLQIEAIEAAITPRTRAVATVSPNNPTGAIYPPSALRAVNDLCKRRGIYHIHDEAYEYFVYGGAHFSPGSLPGATSHTISLFSFSKTYAMAAWRVGYMVIPADLLDAVYKLQDTAVICAPRASQVVALAALRAGNAYCRGHVARLARVRETVSARLGALDGICSVSPPDGAFYCFLRVHSEMDSLTLVRRLVTEYRVAAVPGTAFGLADQCSLRISYGALDEESVGEGVSRLVRGLTALVGSAGR